MNAHTPGPWDLDEGDLRTVYDLETSDVVAEIDFDAGEQVGRIVAAAPELLESLTELIAMCERQVDFNDDRDGLAFKRAHAAIAKAKGQG